MEIEIWKRVKGFNYELSQIVDNFKSLIIDENFQDANKLSLVVSYNQENVGLYVPETIIYAKRVFYFIEDVRVTDVSTNELEVTAKSLYAKANDRIIDTNYSSYQFPEEIVGNIIRDNVTENAPDFRKYDYLKLNSLSPFSASKINYQNSYGIVLKEANTLMQSYNFGIEERAMETKLGNELSIRNFRDLSDTVEISTDYENLLKAGYENSISDFKTRAITLGEGEGENRERVDFTMITREPWGFPRPEGIDLRETYVDARDLQKKNDNTGTVMSDGDYREALAERARTKLMDQQRILSINGQLNMNSDLFILGRDFGLGDMVTIRSSLFGLKKKALITSIKYTFDSSGEYVEPVFGKQSPTVFDLLKRK